MALTDSLISHWKLDEASGNALDAHGSETLTDNNTVGAASGKINGARDFESTANEFFSRTDNANLSTGNIDFTFALWVNLESKPTFAGLIGKWGLDGSRDYFVGYSGGATDRFSFGGTSTGFQASAVSINANNFGAPSTGTWYFIVAWHDATANTINIQVNNGTVDSASHSAGIADTSADFHIGALSSTSSPFDGLIDSVSFWKRVLTSDERTELYNSGNGLDYDDWDAAAGLSIPIAAYHYNHHLGSMA